MAYWTQVTQQALTLICFYMNLIIWQPSFLEVVACCLPTKILWSIHHVKIFNRWWLSLLIYLEVLKSLEMMSGMILKRLQPKFAVKSVPNEMLCLKAMWWPALTGQAFIFNLKIFEQFVFVHNHLFCYQPTIHNSILKICPKFQVLSSHFFKVNELLDEQWAKLYKVKIFQLKSMSNAIRCINQRFAFKNSGISCLALIFNLSNLRTTILHSKKMLPAAKHFMSYAFFFLDWHEPMSWLRWVAVSLVVQIQFLLISEIFCCP